MSLQIGIVGLPNVGKSTLFNALTKSHAAQAENFPFCTIDPNVGIVNVPDSRLDQIAELVKPQKVVPSVIEFVDIAGLVKGASEGEGLGNKFLHHIRECDAIAMVIRFFSDSNVHHVHGNVDPKIDREVIETELIIADLETVNKNIDRLEKEKKSGDKVATQKHGMCERIKIALESGQKANSLSFTPEERLLLRELNLLTAKPFLFLANTSEDELASFNIEEAQKKAGLTKDEIIIPISAKIEAELIDFSEEERQEMLAGLGLKENGLSTVIRVAYQKLGLRSFLTAGEKEVRAWTFTAGWTAPQCAAVIHTDFEKHFIRADVVTWQDFLREGGWHGAREKGLVRSEGKEYIMQDGDVCLFKVNA
jgi:GTP-binding protein YchF